MRERAFLPPFLSKEDPKFAIRKCKRPPATKGLSSSFPWRNCLSFRVVGKEEEGCKKVLASLPLPPCLRGGGGGADDAMRRG